MNTFRRKPPFWRCTKIKKQFDIAKLRPSPLKRGERFETLKDAIQESLRSESLICARLPDAIDARILDECRGDEYDCEQPYCPICARRFRRYFAAELLRLDIEQKVPGTILTVLLETASRGSISKLQIERHREILRKRLTRSLLHRTTVLGGFEMVYRARKKEWMLHVNLLVFDGDEKAIDNFANGFQIIDRAVQAVKLKDKAQQLSYLLKFATYHRPYKQQGSKKSKAVPLNAAEHLELVKWMGQYEFPDYLLLFNARRRGALIELR